MVMLAKLKNKKVLIILIGVVMLAGAGVVWWFYNQHQVEVDDQVRSDAKQIIADDEGLRDQVFDEERAEKYLYLMKRGDSRKAHRVYDKAFAELKDAEQVNMTIEYYTLAQKIKDKDGVLDASLKRHEAVQGTDSAFTVATVYGERDNEEKQVQYLEEARRLDTDAALVEVAGEQLKEIEGKQ